MLTMPVACGKNILEKGRDVKFLKQSKHFPTLQSSEPNNTTILSSTRHESTKPKHTKPNHNLDMHLFVKNKNNQCFFEGSIEEIMQICCKFEYQLVFPIVKLFQIWKQEVDKTQTKINYSFPAIILEKKEEK